MISRLVRSENTAITLIWRFWPGPLWYSRSHRLVPFPLSRDCANAIASGDFRSAGYEQISAIFDHLILLWAACGASDVEVGPDIDAAVQRIDRDCRDGCRAQAGDFPMPHDGPLCALT